MVVYFLYVIQRVVEIIQVLCRWYPRYTGRNKKEFHQPISGIKIIAKFISFATAVLFDEEIDGGSATMALSIRSIRHFV